MPFTTVPDKAAGDIFTEQMWDTYIRDNINYLGTGRDIYVDQYGAVGDGTTNDRQALVDALAACPAGGRVIFDGSKTYAIGGNVYLQKAVTLVLNGATIKQTTANERIFTCATISGQVVIDGGNGTLNANRAVHTTTTYGIVIDTTFSGTLVLRDAKLTSAGGAGIVANSTAAGLLICENVEITDCKDPGIARNAHGLMVQSAHTVRLNNLWVHDNDGSGIKFVSGGTSNKHDCGLIRADRNSVCGVDITAGQGRIDQVFLRDNRSFGISLQASEWNIGSVMERFTGTAWDGNYLDGSGQDPSGTAMRIWGNNNHVGVVSGKVHPGYLLSIIGNYNEVGSVIGDAAGMTGDPGVTLQGGSAHNLIGSVSVNAYTIGLTFGEGSTVTDNMVGVAQVSNCTFGAVQIDSSSARNAIGTLIIRDSYTSTAGAGLIRFLGSSWNYIGLVQEYCSGTKPDYAILFDATATYNYVASASVPFFNTAAVSDVGTSNAVVVRQVPGSKALIVGAGADYGRSGQNLQLNLSGNHGGVALTTWSATSTDRQFVDFNKSASATVGTQALVANGGSLGSIFFRGSDGAAFQEAARIEAEVDAAPSTGTDMPGRLMFRTTADGTLTPTERMRIDNKGNVIIGQPTVELAISATDGFLHIPRMNGAPTSTTPTMYFEAPMVWDYANKKLWLYTSGVWHGSAAFTP
jgi:hypothetical protein